MRDKKAKATIGILSTLIGYVTVNSIYKSLHPEAFIWYDEDREEGRWLASSKSWLDRKACRWLGVCGISHLQFVGDRFGRHDFASNHQQPLDLNGTHWDWRKAWTEGKDRPEDWTDDERVLREVPDYVMEFAPLVHLFSGEQFWPCDIAEHLYHVTPTLNYTPLEEKWLHPTLQDLNKLNQFEGGRHIFLTSKDDPEGTPEWLEGEKNIPNAPRGGEESFGPHTDGTTYGDRIKDTTYPQQEWYDSGSEGFSDEVTLPNGEMLVPSDTPEGEELLPEHDSTPSPFTADLRRRAFEIQPSKSLTGGRSGAPAVLVVVNKGHGIVDAFWFFFYSFNLGNVVFNVRFGNHVGDWEHTAIRFHHGEPKAVFFSEHNFGSAYSYKAVEKIGKRPVIYSATGTHAMYATPGTHAYVLPWGLLHDQTDRGPLWDPALNIHAYTYDHLNDTLRSSQLSPKAPTEWFHFNGHWGDKFYPLGDARQYRFAGQYHYVNGPLGPKFKNLGRTHICPDGSAPCIIKNWLGGGTRIRRGVGPGEGEEMSEDDQQRFLNPGNDTDRI